MKQSEVEIGAVYVVTVSGTRVPVKIVRESLYGGWEGVNLRTGRDVRIQSAQRLQRRITRANDLGNTLIT